MTKRLAALLPLLLTLALPGCVHGPREAARELVRASALAPSPAPAPAPAIAQAAAADRDGDGFLDVVDRCADDPGVEPDGCPIPDAEGDGILDPDDRCPTEAETRNGYQDEDGCPDRVPSQLAKFTGTIKGVHFGGGRNGTPVALRPPLARGPAGPQVLAPSRAGNTEAYARAADNPFVRVADDPVATFAADVDTASYSNVRRFLNAGQLPPPDAVRIEELINYFDYDYPQPAAGETFAVVTEVGPCPWNPANRLVHIGVQTKAIAAAEVPARNLVFLIDVSGSMGEPNKLPLLQRALGRLVDDLRPRDRVAMVVYAGAAGVVLPPTTGDQRKTIRAALDRLSAGGSTAGGEGIRLAYALAEQNFARGAINRVILATDGDFNVGVSDVGSLTRLIEDKRKTGVALTVLGLGTDNLNDELMEGLADKGDGNYAYLDSLEEAHKVLVREASGTLVTVARDVKLQVEWNPARVASYRQIGYDNRQLHDRDFKDDSKDAGEVGAGHAVTALFEIAPRAAKTEGDALELRYQGPRPVQDREGELFTLKLRSKTPAGAARPELARVVRDPGAQALSATSEDFRLSAAVAEFGLLLRAAPERAKASYEDALRLARGARGRDPHGDRAELVVHIEAAQAGIRAMTAQRAAEAAWLAEVASTGSEPITPAVRRAAKIPAAALPALERAAEMLREFPTIRLEISGHTDDREGRSRGELVAISRARAEAVKRYLVSSGRIHPDRLEIRPAGPDEPVDTNKTAAGRARNRRAEFTVLVQ